MSIMDRSNTHDLLWNRRRRSAIMLKNDWWDTRYGTMPPILTKETTLRHDQFKTLEEAEFFSPLLMDVRERLGDKLTRADHIYFRRKSSKMNSIYFITRHLADNGYRLVE